MKIREQKGLWFLQLWNLGMMGIYLLTPYWIPQLNVYGQMTEVARGLTGFLLLVVSILALVSVVINFLQISHLKEKYQPTVGVWLATAIHFVSFFYMGVFKGIPAALGCLLSVSWFIYNWKKGEFATSQEIEGDVNDESFGVSYVELVSNQTTNKNTTSNDQIKEEE